MTANLRVKLTQILDIVLRVPPVFIMDAILHKGYSYEYSYRLRPNKQVDDDGGGDSSSSQPVAAAPAAAAAVGYVEDDEAGGPGGPGVDYVFVSSISFDLQTIILFSVHTSGFLIAFLIFLLSREHLLSTYKWMLSVSTVCLSYWINTSYLTRGTSGFEMSFWLVNLLQLGLTAAFGVTTKNSQSGTLSVMALGTFLLPSVLSGVDWLPSHYVKALPLLSAFLSLMLIKVCFILKIKAIYKVLRDGVRRSRMIMHYYGMHTLLENEWLRLNVPHVLRVFWLTRVTEHVVYLVADKVQPQAEVQLLIATSLDGLSHSVRDLLVQGCDTMVAVLGMTSVVASVSHYLGSLMQQFLLTEDEDEKSIGTVSAVLFFILALQTGLTGLEPEKRFVRLYRNFCLLFTAILHFIHNMVNPLLMSLSASRNRSVHRHGRALAVCGFLILFPCWFLAYLWRNHSVSTWLLAVSAFSIEVVIKVIISLLIYVLFMVDAYRNSFWGQLDDYVYYIRATGNTIEFVFGIFLFFNGAWILLFESGGAIRACMMCIHAYFNIWLQARAGWRTFMKRRTAVNKINALPEATEEQLRRFDDVCAICYQELTNARITKCNHYFHGVCLRKWLYVQDRCPLCHDTLYKLDSDGEDSSPERAAHPDDDEVEERVVPVVAVPDPQPPSETAEPPQVPTPQEQQVEAATDALPNNAASTISIPQLPPADDTEHEHQD